MSIIHRKFAALLGWALLFASSASGGWTQIPSAPLPLGDPSLDEVRWQRTVSSGVTLYSLQRGDPDHVSLWTLSAGVARNHQERSSAERCLVQLGLTPKGQSYPFPGRPHGHHYVEVVGGEFRNEIAANLAASRAKGCNLKARALAASPHDRLGPWRIQIVEIDPKRFRGHLLSVLGDDERLKSRKPSEMAHQLGALLAVNGGFFVTDQNDGIVGGPTGLAVLNDRIRNLPTEDRPFLILYDEPQIGADIIDHTPPPLRIRWSDGTTTPLMGLDRRPGRVRNCGSKASPAAAIPRHDITCELKDDLIALTAMAPLAVDGPGLTTVLVDTEGQLSKGRPPRGDELLLVGTGSYGSLLAQKLKQQARAHIDLSYSGMTQTARRPTFAINGGPMLINANRPVRRDDREGWSMSNVTIARANVIHDWTTMRNPRTAVGIDPQGHIWILVVDGREFSEQSSSGLGRSSGLSIEELRTVMAYLGASKALNLDGGGSSALVVDGALVTTPSDTTGERPVGDTIVLTP